MLKMIAASMLTLGLLSSQAAAADLFVKHGTNLNCRTGPSTKHVVVAVLAPKQPVTTLSHYEGWTKVRASKVTCWTVKSFLTADPHHVPKKPKVIRHAKKAHVPHKFHKPKCVKHPVLTVHPDHRYASHIPTHCTGIAIGHGW
ncbi:MAG: SH3 domain-containing protein [Pseudomonadota bacterium]